MHFTLFIIMIKYTYQTFFMYGNPVVYKNRALMPQIKIFSAYTTYQIIWYFLGENEIASVHCATCAVRVFGSPSQLVMTAVLAERRACARVRLFVSTRTDCCISWASYVPAIERRAIERFARTRTRWLRTLQNGSKIFQNTKKRSIIGTRWRSNGKI